MLYVLNSWYEEVLELNIHTTLTTKFIYLIFQETFMVMKTFNDHC